VTHVYFEVPCAYALNFLDVPTPMDPKRQIVKIIQGSTRHGLAAKAGVGVGTLKRILDGNLPDFSRESNRTLRLWRDAFERLAEVAGVAAEDVWRSYGLPGDPRDAVVGWSGRHSSSLLEAIPDGRVHVALSIYHPYHEPKAKDSFLNGYSQMLFGAVDADWEIEGSDWDALPAEFLPQDPRVPSAGAERFVFGYLRSVSRERMGFDFLEIPGLGLSLSAVVAESNPLGLVKATTWDDIEESFLNGKLELVDLGDEVGAEYLRGLKPGSHYRRTKLAVGKPQTRDERYRAIAKHLISRQRELDVLGSAAAVALVADEETCRQVIVTSEERIIEVGAGTGGLLAKNPKYPVSVAISEKISREILPLLENAQRSVLFGNASRRVAGMYADALLKATTLPVDGRLACTRRSNWSLEPFPFADPKFKLFLANRLNAGLEQAFSNRPELLRTWLQHFIPRVWIAEVLEFIASYVASISPPNTEQTRKLDFDLTPFLTRSLATEEVGRLIG